MRMKLYHLVLAVFASTLFGDGYDNDIIGIPQSQQLNFSQPVVTPDVDQRVTQTVTIIVAVVYSEVAEIIKSNQNLIQNEQYQKDTIENAKKLAQDFVRRFIPPSKVEEAIEYQNTDPVGGFVLMTVAHRVQTAVMAMESPIKSFLEMMATMSDPQNLINYFLAISITPTKALMIELRAKNRDDEIQRDLQPRRRY